MPVAAAIGVSAGVGLYGANRSAKATEDAGKDAIEAGERGLGNALLVGDEVRGEQISTADAGFEANMQAFSDNLATQLGLNADALANQLNTTSDTLANQLGTYEAIFGKVMEQAGHVITQAEGELGTWRDAGKDALQSIRESYDNGTLQSPKYQKFMAENYNPAQFEKEFSPETFNEKYKTKEFNFEADPGYQHRKEEGEKGIKRAAAASGTTQGGAFQKGMARFNSNLASQEYQNAFNRHLATTDRDYRDFTTGESIFRRNQDTLRADDLDNYSRFETAENKRRDDFYANRDLAYGEHTNAFNAERNRRDTEFGRRMDISDQGYRASRDISGVYQNVNNNLTQAELALGGLAGSAYGQAGRGTADAYGNYYANQGNINTNYTGQVTGARNLRDANVQSAHGQYGATATNQIYNQGIQEGQQHQNIGIGRSNAISGGAQSINSGIENYLLYDYLRNRDGATT